MLAEILRKSQRKNQSKLNINNTINVRIDYTVGNIITRNVIIETFSAVQ